MNSIARFLRPTHVLLELEVTSKKRLFEQIGLLFENSHQVARGVVFDALFAREKLGSTGLGNGLALPHGRIKGLREPVCAFIRTAMPIPFESPDAQAVSMTFVLLTSDHPSAQHLHILSEVALLLSDKERRDSLASAVDSAVAYDLLTQSAPYAGRQRTAALQR